MSTPLSAKPNVITSPVITVRTGSAGQFSTSLQGGLYLVQVGTNERDRFRIAVPSADTNTYDMSDLVASTNMFAWPPADGILSLTNLTDYDLLTPSNESNMTHMPKPWYNLISANTAGPLSVMRVTGASDHWVFQRLGTSPDFVRWSLALDASMGTGLENFDHVNIERKAEWVPIWRPDSTWSGTWLLGNSSSASRSTIYQYSRDLEATVNTVSFDVPVTEAGELWLSYMGRADAGYFYVWIDGGTTLADALPTSAGRSYVDAYAATTAFRSVKVSSRLKPGMYTVLLQRSSTERNASNTTDHRFYPDAWAVVNAERGIPGTAAERLITGYAQSILCNTNSTTNIHTATLLDPAGPDVVLLTTDYIYVGHDSIHEAMDVAFTVPNLNSNTNTAQYWDGVNWTNLTIIDGTTGFTTDGVIAWVPPSDWVGKTVYYATGNAYRYWLRIKPGADTTVMQFDRVLSSAQLVHRHEYLQYVCMAGAQYEYAYWVQPEGGPAQAVGGARHGGEKAIGMTVSVDNAAVTLPLGVGFPGDVIQIYQTMDVTNATVGTIGTGFLSHTFTSDGMAIGWQHTFSTASTVTNYAYTGMMPVFYWLGGTATNVFQFDRLALHTLWGWPTNVDATTLDPITFVGQIPCEELLAYGTTQPYVALIAQDNARTVNRSWTYAGDRDAFWFFNDLNYPVGGVNSIRSKAYFTLQSTTNTFNLAVGDTLGATTRYKVARVPKLAQVLFPK